MFATRRRSHAAARLKRTRLRQRSVRIACSHRLRARGQRLIVSRAPRASHLHRLEFCHSKLQHRRLGRVVRFLRLRRRVNRTSRHLHGRRARCQVWLRRLKRLKAIKRIKKTKFGAFAAFRHVRLTSPTRGSRVLKTRYKKVIGRLAAANNTRWVKILQNQRLSEYTRFLGKQVVRIERVTRLREIKTRHRTMRQLRKRRFVSP
jgi:hypothetical protein